MAFIAHHSSRFQAALAIAMCIGITSIGCGTDPSVEGTAVSNEAIEAFVNTNPKYAESAKTTNSVSMPNAATTNAQKTGQPRDAASATTLSVEN